MYMYSSETFAAIIPWYVFKCCGNRLKLVKFATTVTWCQASACLRGTHGDTTDAVVESLFAASVFCFGAACGAAWVGGTRRALYGMLPVRTPVSDLTNTADQFSGVSFRCQVFFAKNSRGNCITYFFRSVLLLASCGKDSIKLDFPVEISRFLEFQRRGISFKI